VRNVAKRKKISSQIKSQILSEALMPGCIISELAKSHGISPSHIYRWRKKQNLTGSASVKAKPKTSLENTNNFVELSMQDPTDSTTNFVASSKSYSTLSKASLIFNDFSLVIEGDIKSSSLFAIVQILEEAC
jgi:transposase-like protein